MSITYIGEYRNKVAVIEWRDDIESSKADRVLKELADNDYTTDCYTSGAIGEHASTVAWFEVEDRSDYEEFKAIYLKAKRA